jgi:pimeloyl-ACP methyl ester carboxylesterase
VISARVRAWRQAGELVVVDGHQIFVREQDGEGPGVLLLHGFPSSSYDWRALFELLPGRRLLALDFLGFGLSDKPPDHVYSLRGQADRVERIVAAWLGEPPLVVAHDMGDSVATELMARDLEGTLSFQPRAVLLLNGSVVLERASLTISQKLLRSRVGPVMARLSNQRSFRLQLRRIFSAQHPLTDEEAADQWALLARGGGHHLLHRLIYYLHERVHYAERWHGALRDWPGTLELGWAGEDSICTEAVLQAILDLRPQAPLTRLPGVGHYPQIEAPEQVLECLDRLTRSVSARRCLSPGGRRTCA